jgi:hypothetical protein
MVDAEEVMIDEALDEVEQPRTDEQRADERSPPHESPELPAGAPQEDEPEHGHDPGGAVKEAVGEGIQLDVVPDRLVLDRGEHVMPLEHLVQQDAVGEPTQGKPQDDAGPGDPHRLQPRGAIHLAFTAVLCAKRTGTG